MTDDPRVFIEPLCEPCDLTNPSESSHPRPLVPLPASRCTACYYCSLLSLAPLPSSALCSTCCELRRGHDFDQDHGHDPLVAAHCCLLPPTTNLHPAADHCILSIGQSHPQQLPIMSSEPANGAGTEGLRVPSSDSPRPTSSSLKRNYSGKKEAMNGPLYRQTVNHTVLVRRLKRKGDGPSKQLARWFVENQIGMPRVCISSSYTPLYPSPTAAWQNTTSPKLCAPHRPPSGHYTACCMSLPVALRQLPAENEHLARSTYLLMRLRRRLLIQPSCASVLRPLSPPQVTVLHGQIRSPSILQCEFGKVWRWLRRLLLCCLRRCPPHRPASCDNGVCPGSVRQVHGHQ